MYENIQLHSPDFESPLTDLIIKLDVLRNKIPGGSTPPGLFGELKAIFHMLESVHSARIEGNNTTIFDYADAEYGPPAHKSEQIVEVENMHRALDFIDDALEAQPMDREFVCELHRIAVERLIPPPNGEGDETPGAYRQRNVRIGNSEHRPPDWTDVQWYMQELFDFINRADPEKFDLLKACIAHHRFVWIHPFSNGNGRVVRLFNYALWIKYGFKLNRGRIINPSAMFCVNRQEYYRHLAGADSGSREGILQWCGYVLEGLKSEIEKIDELLDYDALKKKILLPAIKRAWEKNSITLDESIVLRRGIELRQLKASDVKELFIAKKAADISYLLKKLREKELLKPETENGRTYLVSFLNRYLLKEVFQSLTENGFVD
jgi:Fic family protein